MKKKCVNLIDLNHDRSEKIRYTFPELPFYFHKGRFSSYPDYVMEEHWHDDIELVIALSGHMTYNVNGQLVRIDEGEGIFINSRRLHSAFSEDRTECRYIVILFHPMLLCTARQLEQELVLPVLDSSLDFIRLKQDETWEKEIIRYVHLIAEKMEENAAALTAIGSLHIIWSEIVQHTDIRLVQVKKDTQLSVLKTMISFVHEHFPEKITLAEIAKVGCVSKRTCENLFLKYVHKTPITFLNEYRLRKSIALMQNTDMTILEISLACGFSGASYYAECFRRSFGESPAEYRRNRSRNTGTEGKMKH